MGERLLLGVHLMTYGATWPEVAAFAREVDRLGYDFLLMHDHLLATQGDLQQPFFESYTTLGAFAAITSRVHLGHLTVGNPLRNPGVVAKATATLDHISNGRMTLCLGAGSLPEEFPRHGLALGQRLGDRLRALEESLSIVTRILAGDEVTFESPNYHLDRVAHRPLPLQARIPVIVGASGEKVGLRIAARFADYWQTSVGPADLQMFRHKQDVLAGHCTDAGRDPGAIRHLPEGDFILRETADQAARAFAAHASHFAWSPASRAAREASLWAGPSAEVAERLRPLRVMGIGGLIYQALPPYDFETIRRLATEVAPALSG